jgi:hypothetical protein
MWENPVFHGRPGFFCLRQKITRLAPGCKIIADVLISVRYFSYGTGTIFGDQRL